MAHVSIFRGGRREGVFHLPEKPVLIGRADGVDIQLLDSRVSRRHAVIRESVAGYIIQDLDTKNGTFVNDEAIERSLLFHSDSVEIGGYTLKFLEDQDEASAPSGASGALPPPDEGLRVPEDLRERGSNPRARTAQSLQGAPPERVNRLDRDREREREEAGRRARAAVSAATRGARSPTGEVPVVEAPGAGTARESRSSLSLDFSLSEFDSGGGDPDPAPPGTARQRAPDLRQEAQQPHEVQSPHSTGRPEIREFRQGGGGVRFLPEEGTTSCGFEFEDDVLLPDEGIGTLFTVRRRGNQMVVRSGSSLRPVLLNGSPVVSAEAFPGDVFEVGGRVFEIHITVGSEPGVVPSAETRLGIDSRAIEDSLRRRKAEAMALLGVEGGIPRYPSPTAEVLQAAAPGGRPSARPGSTHGAADGVHALAETQPIPAELLEEDDEWIAESLPGQFGVSAVEATLESPPMVHEPLLIEGASASDVYPISDGEPPPTLDDPGEAPRAAWADDWLMPGAGGRTSSEEAERMSAGQDSGRRKRAKLGSSSKLPQQSFLPPAKHSDE